MTVGYSVSNPGTENLYFSIGAHPAFNCPLHADEKRSDYDLVFEKLESIESQLIESGIRTGDTKPVLNNQTTLKITDDLFEEDALILEDLKSDSITIQKGEKPILTMHFKGFPYFGIWSKNEQSPFVCLEPWFGIADHQDHDHDYKKKEGVICLESGEDFQCNYSLIIY